MGGSWKAAMLTLLSAANALQAMHHYRLLSCQNCNELFLTRNGKKGKAYAESERNWRRSLQEIANGDNPQAQIFVAEDGTGAVIGLAMGGPPKQEALLPNSGEIYVLYVRDAHQRRDLGRALVTVAATQSWSMG